MSRQIGRFGKQITAAVDDLTTVVDTAEQTRSLPMNKKLVFNSIQDQKKISIVNNGLKFPT